MTSPLPSVLDLAMQDLLRELHDSHEHGAFAMACDGADRAVAHQLDKAGLARWTGTNWGSSFWTITDAGIEAVHEHAMPEPVYCRGCGEEISGEISDLCWGCDYEQQAERAADERAER